MKRLVSTLLFALLVALFLPLMAHAQAPDLIAQADKAFAEKSYARAVELYRQAKANPPVREPERVDYRIAVSLFKTEKWDEAIKSATYGAENASWKARFRYLLGLIYVQSPKNAWKIGDRTLIQDEYPEVQGDEKPQQIYLGEEHQKLALENFEEAKVLAQKERDLSERARFFAPIFPLDREEEADLNFDLAAYLSQHQFDEFINSIKDRKTGPFDDVIDLAQPYTRGWSMPKKVLYLYHEIRKLDSENGNGDFARALLAEGLFLRSYQARMKSARNVYDEELKKQILLPYPFQDALPTVVWRRIVNEFPKSELAPQALLLIGETHQSENDLVKARAAFRELVQKYPNSKWATNARAHLAQIEKEELGFSLAKAPRPGENVVLRVNARNVPKVDFAAYRVKLEEFLADPTNLRDPQTQFTEFAENFGTIEEIQRKLGKAVARWSHDTKDKGNYQGTSAEVKTPLSQLGAYVVVAGARGEKFAQVVVISDLALLKKTDRDNSFVYVADAKSGEPVNGANVVLKETWNDSGPKTDFKQGRSDDGGFFDKKLARQRNYSQVAAFAWVGDRYAITGTQSGYYGYYGERTQTRVLGTTDRPVYRPGQTVYFRQLVARQAEGGDWKPLVGRKVHIGVRDPQGKQIYQVTTTLSEFGSANGEFKLPDDVPLGVFQMMLENADGQRFAGDTQFRVEEYKRPEFEVTVTAPQEAKKPGEVVAARINARYYFGAPVPNAKVKYTVRKSSWWASYKFPTPYDWLYASWGVGQYDTGRRNIGGEGAGAIVKEGEVTTDDSGFAELSFKTDEITDTPNNWWERYSNPLYTIEAEVTDASRRTIEAQGEVKVARQPYFAFLDVKRGFFQKGDRAPIEIRTQDANEQPVSAAGKMVVYRLLPGDKEEKVFEEAVSTDKEGRAFWNWQADESGQFRIEFVGDAIWGEAVKAQTEIWVVGENIGQIRLQGVTVLLDKRSYEQGETLKAAIVADTPGATVLLTQEATGEILRRDLIRVEGKSKTVEIPIEKQHVPNFFLAAALIQNFEIYQAQTEVFVPPVRQLLNVKVEGDKDVYKPGETGTFKVTARDYSGAPARAEVSLALADASLFYIQKSFTPDIRTFFYGDRRANTVNLDSSRSGNPQARRESDDKPDKFDITQWVLPDEFGQLQLTPGGYYYGYDVRFRAGTRFAMPRNAAFAYSENEAMPMAAPAPILSDAPALLHRTGTANYMAKAQTESGGEDVQIRSNFAETAYWSPAVVTENGEATVRVTFPDSLTQWNAKALGLTNSVQVGAAEENVATKKDLLVRLQAPRFFVERDEVVISANVHNYSDKEQKVNVALNLPQELQLVFPIDISQGKPYDGPPPRNFSEVVIPAGGEKRVDWNAKVQKAGEATFQVTAKTATDSDAVKMSFPVLVHGAPVFKGEAGVMKSDGTARVTLNLPAERQLGASQLNVQLNPSLAATMLDALPYLADYPYGCVEQTMSRFLPAVLTEKTLRDANINLTELRRRALAYEAESKTQAIGERVKNTGYTFPQGQPNSRDFGAMAERMWFNSRGDNPVFEEAKLRDMIQDGLNRLASMQREDGGWGWFPGAPSSDEYMSAYVVYGLSQAQNAGVNVPGNVLNRGRSYLEAQMKDEANIHLLTYIAYSLSQRGMSNATKQIAAGRLFEQRERLTPLSKSYLALALHRAGETEKANVLIRNLENTVQIDASNGTARYKQQPQWWHWWNNDTETVALALRAFVAIEPNNKLVPMFTKWLTLQARGGHWRSTKETAEVVYTLGDVVKQNDELNVDYTLKVNLNGKLARTYRVNRDNVLWFDNRFITGDLFLENGANTLTIEKAGKGNLYWNAYLEYFSLEEGIKGSGNELEVTRRYFKLTRKATEAEKAEKPEAAPAVATAKVAGRRIAPPFPRPSEESEPEYDRTEIKDSAQVQSGDLIEVELVLNAKNDYSYLVFEDMKAAGLEPVTLRSGYEYGEGLSYYVELRDEKVAFFFTNLPQGRRVLRHRMRAEMPGTFHALPTNGYAMYAPEVRATSDEMRISVRD